MKQVLGNVLKLTFDEFCNFSGTSFIKEMYSSDNGP